MSLPPLHITIGHNGGPPKVIPYNTMVRRVRLAEALGLTFEEYTLEILFNGRYLQSEDKTRIAEIKSARGRRD